MDGTDADKLETQTPHSFSAPMKVHQQLLETDVELTLKRQMSRYMDSKKLKLKDEDREIFVLRLAQVRALTKKYIWQCVAKMEGFL